MGILHCPKCGTPLVRVPDDPSTFEAREGVAVRVPGDFFVRCPECETMSQYNENNLRQKYLEAEAVGSVVAGEIEEAAEAWGFQI